MEGGPGVVSDEVSADDQPVLLKDLKKELGRGARVLFHWDSVPGEFSELRPAVFVCEEQDNVWIKPKGLHALRAERDEICSCPFGVELEELETSDVGQCCTNGS